MQTVYEKPTVSVQDLPQDRQKLLGLTLEAVLLEHRVLLDCVRRASVVALVIVKTYLTAVTSRSPAVKLEREKVYIAIGK